MIVFCTVRWREVVVLCGETGLDSSRNQIPNPCDAILEHARKQRLIENVGDLYDILVDCEFPRLANLL